MESIESGAVLPNAVPTPAKTARTRTSFLWAPGTIGCGNAVDGGTAVGVAVGAREGGRGERGRLGAAVGCIVGDGSVVSGDGMNDGATVDSEGATVGGLVGAADGINVGPGVGGTEGGAFDTVGEGVEATVVELGVEVDVGDVVTGGKVAGGEHIKPMLTTSFAL
jgi:hypothetical protein